MSHFLRNARLADFEKPGCWTPNWSEKWGSIIQSRGFSPGKAAQHCHFGQSNGSWNPSMAPGDSGEMMQEMQLKCYDVTLNSWGRRVQSPTNNPNNLKYSSLHAKIHDIFLQTKQPEMWKTSDFPCRCGTRAKCSVFDFSTRCTARVQTLQSAQSRLFHTSSP